MGDKKDVGLGNVINEEQEVISDKGQAGGYAPLDGDALVPDEHLPEVGPLVRTASTSHDAGETADRMHFGDDFAEIPTVTVSIRNRDDSTQLLHVMITGLGVDVDGYFVDTNAYVNTGDGWESPPPNHGYEIYAIAVGPREE